MTFRVEYSLTLEGHLVQGHTLRKTAFTFKVQNLEYNEGEYLLTSTIIHLFVCLQYLSNIYLDLAFM